MRKLTESERWKMYHTERYVPKETLVKLLMERFRFRHETRVGYMDLFRGHGNNIW